MSPQQRPLGGDPGSQLSRPQQGRVVLAEQPAVVEPAQPAAADLLTAAAGDSAVAAAGQRPCPGRERIYWLGPLLSPGPFVPEAQAVAVQLAPAARHQAAAACQRPAQHAAQWRGIELVPADPGRQPGPAAAVASAVMVAGGGGAARSRARPRRGPVAAQVTGEQPPLVIPLTRAPAQVQMIQ